MYNPGPARRFSMSRKLPVAALFQAVALLSLLSACGGGPRPAGLSGAGSASPAPAAQTPDPCADLEDPLPPPAGHVADFAGVIDDETKRRLEEKLTRLKTRAEIELAVATVKTTAGQTAADYSLALARCWGVGPREGRPGGGVLLLVAVEDRRWHAQVSRQLENDLPDDAVAEAGDRMKPYFLKGDYGPGLEACADGLIARLSSRRGFRPD